jgi:hypothetical protein
MNTSLADSGSIAAELAQHTGCDSRNRDYTSGSWSWDDALLVWNLKPVVPSL